MLLAVVTATLLTPQIAAAASVAKSDSGSKVVFKNEKAAKNHDTGIPSFVVSPGESMQFQVEGDQPDTYDEISVSNTPNFGKKFNSTFYDYSFVWRRVQLGDYKWTWVHYNAWAGANSCVVTRYNNDQWSGGQGVLWHYQGAGSYIVNRIDACTWWGGRQGHYAYCPISFGCIQDDWPWNVNQYFGWGAVRVYDYGR